MSQPTTVDANDVLFGGGGAPAVAWQNPTTNQDYPVGTSYEGEILKLDAVQQRNIQDKSKLDFWPDGKPKMVALVTIQTALRDPQREADDGQRTVWVSGKYLTDAVRVAVRKAGAQKLDVGGYLKVTLTGYGKPEPGFRAPRLFEVEYRKPVPGAAAANEALGWYDQGGQLPPAATTTPFAQPVTTTPVQQQLPTVQPGGAPTSTSAAMPDLSGLDANARALVERMYAAQQAGAQA